MSKEYIPNPNTDMNAQQYQPPMQPVNPQPPKRDNRVFALLCIILALLLAIITAVVIIFLIPKEDEMKEVRGKKSPETSTVQSSTVEEEKPTANLPVVEIPSADNGDALTPVPTPAPEPTPVPEQGEKDDSRTPVKPADGIQTLEYFNAAINKVKTKAKSVEQKKVENYLASSPTIPSALNGIYKMLGGDSWLDKMLKDNSQGAATLKGGDIKAKFPVEGETYASVLQPADVKAATCTESNGIYTITITTLPDGKSTAHKHGAGRNPKAFNVILPGTVNSNIPGAAKSLVGEAAMAYPSSTIVITVDAATGNVLTANYDLKWTISFTKMNASIPLGTKSVYEIKW